jgi:hypothetical protein
MKSTGLFGKNSGRVGGVVYSNYRGQQVVRSYQPQVKNPKSVGQIAQRAKFKLVSQIAASLGEDLMSFIPGNKRQTNRNAFVSKMLSKAMYQNNEASLPIEEIVLTNSLENWIGSIDSQMATIAGTLIESFIDISRVRVRVVFIGYNNEGVIEKINALESVPTKTEGRVSFTFPRPATSRFTNIRALVYAYELGEDAPYFNDYEVLGDDATLDVLIKQNPGSIRFSSTYNVLMQQEV